MTALRHYTKMKKTGEVRVGVGAIVVRDGKVLLGYRRGSHGEGTWALPGGHLEYGENAADCAIREVAEETGLRIHDIRPGPYTNDIFDAEGMHYVTLFVVASCHDGEAAILEPEKCDAWRWFYWDNLPEPLFLPLQSLRSIGFLPA